MAQKTILVVDDQITTREMVAQALGQAGFLVEQASSGEEMLIYLKENNVHKKTDMILLDFHMPGANGLDILDRARRENLIENTVVVMMTTEARDDLRQLGKSLGLQAWIIKPFPPENLIPLAHKLIDKRESWPS